MIRIKDIQEELKGLVGWEQSVDDRKEIDVDLTDSESGLYFQGAHPLLTLANIEAIMPAGDITLSDYLRRETNKAITTVLQRFQTNKTLEQGSNRVLQKDTFYPTSQYHAQAVASANSKVGFEIKQKRSVGVSVRINKIGLKFTAPCTVVVKLEHSGKSHPVKVFELEYALENQGTQWFEVDDTFIAGEEESYGTWRLTYDQRTLPVDVLGISPGPVHSCARNSTKYVTVVPIRIEQGGKRDYSKHTPGINVDVTIGCDITDFIIKQRHSFANVIQLQVATTLLRTMAMNPDARVNSNQSNVSRLDILYELDGNTAGYRPGGLGNALKQAYEEISIDTTGIDSFCLPCRRKGVKYRTV